MLRLTITISILFFALVIRFFTFYQDQPKYKDGQPLSLETTLFSEGTQAGKYQRITARLPHGDRVFISTASYPRYTYGQTLSIKGELQIKNVERGTIYTMSYPKIALLNCHPGLSRISSFDSGCTSFTRMTAELIAPLRARIMWLFQTSLPQPAGNLLLGIVFGIQEGMPKAFDEMLQKAGVLHVIAASGMNVTLIGGFLAALFVRVLRRQYAVALTIIVIIFYAGLAGFSASIVRASIMGILVFSAQILGRQTLALYGLLLAAFSMLFYQPFLLYDTGFQLSFMATWGLIVFNPLMQHVLNRKGWFIDLIAKSDFLTTLVAQLVTLPIILGTFGAFSPVSIITNFLLLWTIPLLMIIGGIGTMVGLIIPFLGQWIFYLALPFLYYFESVVWFFGSLPVGITVTELPWTIIVGYYCLLIAGVLSVKRKMKSEKQQPKT